MGKRRADNLQAQTRNDGMRLREKSWVDLESPYRNRIRRSYEVFQPASYVPSDPLTSAKRVRSRRDYSGSDRDGLKSGTTHRTHETSFTSKTSRTSRPVNGSLVREGTFFSSGPKKEGSFMKSTRSTTRSNLSLGSSRIDGVPEVPLAEAPTILTTAGSFRLSYTDLNKLGYRRIAQPDYGGRFLRDREDSFVNDAIITERKRTKYKDIIPRYSADGDKHCIGYFKRPDVQKLLNVTCSLKPWERDVKPEYIRMERNPYL